MTLWSYRIKLIDPLFFSREGISGAFTPPYIHATALNYAVASSIGKCREDQLYITADADRGRNTPWYKSSKIEKDFYLTPARLCSSPNYYVEVVKGDGDRLIEIGYGSKQLEGVQVGRNEVLKAYRLFSLAPESIFEGYLYTVLEPQEFPRLIRLGSFRSIAIFNIEEEYRIIRCVEQKLCDHAVDPLVNKVLRGVMVPILPYPIIDQPLVSKAWEIRKNNRPTYVAAVSMDNREPTVPRRGNTIII